MRRLVSGRAAAATAGTLGLLAAWATPAAAVPSCDGASTPRVLAANLGTLESVISGADGRLYFTSTQGGEGRLMVLPRRRARPRVVTAPIRSPGGLAIDDRGRVLVGFGNSIPNGVIGTIAPTSGLLRVEPGSGRRKLFVRGLSMANGIVRARDGTIYASDDGGTNIDRVRPDGRVDHGWLRTLSPNGLVLSRDQSRLFWAQTFVPAAISSAPVADPARSEVYARPSSPLDVPAGLDGMDQDGRDRLFVTANALGEVWRVDRSRQICRVAAGLQQPSAVAFGSGRRGFDRDDLYVVEFGGRVTEIRAARAARFR